MDQLTILENSTSGLPVGELPDFKGATSIAMEGMTPHAKKYLEKYKPWLDNIDFGSLIFGGPAQVKKHEGTYRLLTAVALSHIAKTPRSVLQREATLAGTDIPTFTKLLIKAVMQAYPAQLGPQFFPTVPLTNGPDGRVYFPKFQYSSAFASSSPNIADGDDLADLSKFNKDFFKHTEQLKQVGQLKVDYSNYINCSAVYRAVTAITSFESEDYFMDIYNGDLWMTLGQVFKDTLGWVADRELIDAALAAVPPGSLAAGGHEHTWTREPTIDSKAWVDLMPSEREAYRTTIWSDGIEPLRSAIYRKYYVFPNWVIAGTGVAEDLRKCTSFQPITSDPNVIQLRIGAIRDLGTLDSGSMRVVVDPQMDANTALLGYMPSRPFEPAIHYLPYKPLRYTDEVVTPGQLKKEKAAYTSFGVGKPDAGNPASAILGHVYGKLSVI